MTDPSLLAPLVTIRLVQEWERKAGITIKDIAREVDKINLFMDGFFSKIQQSGLYQISFMSNTEIPSKINLLQMPDLWESRKNSFPACLK
jgi:hypothetical protein